MNASLDEVQAKIRAYFPKEPYHLDFKRISDNAIACKCCGQFFIGKYWTRAGDFFEVWFRPKDGQALQLRTNLTTGTDAKNWASAIAAAYRRGNISLKAPPTKEEIADLERVRKAG